MTFQNQHAKVIRIEISVGNDDSNRTLEQFEQDVRKALVKARAKSVTLQGGYYIIDGKVCLSADYDPEEQDRKPGTYPPVWAGGPSEQERKSPYQTQAEDDSPREFVRVKPTKSNQRDPKTGRRYRSDRGVKRGPRKPADTERETA